MQNLSSTKNTYNGKSLHNSLKKEKKRAKKTKFILNILKYTLIKNLKQ